MVRAMKRYMLLVPLLAPVLAVAACGGSMTGSRESRFAGDVTPEGVCGAKSHGTLTTERGKFAFTPTDGVLLIAGDVGADGVLAGELATNGADHKPYVMTFHGTMTDDKVTGRYVTPRCAYGVSLARIRPSLF